MHSPADLKSKIENALAKLALNNNPAELYDSIRYMLSFGGKRMRPVLVMMGCDMFSGDVEKAIPAALGIELFHNFTLLHDDIMDNAPLRRSRQTVHEKWNVSTAILSGDAMFVKSYQLMMMAENKIVKDILDIFSRTAIEVCEGQQLDMNFEQHNDICIADYINMISCKTAVLLGASLQIGAIVAGASSPDAGHLYNFGKNIGIAFQLRDDLLDVYADKTKFGKQVGGDILSGKKTFLFLKAAEVLDEQSRKMLEQLYVKSSTVNKDEKLKSVISLFDKAHVKQLAKDEMQHFHNNALQHFAEINLPAENKKPLLDFCENLMVREI
ncbi:MAG TPA: polyprenyl synthetase family protein [Bacteroidia bacterium]|nr:polyprenyl synthetase family protein [Bacteroidia bacterium]